MKNRNDLLARTISVLLLTALQTRPQSPSLGQSTNASPPPTRASVLFTNLHSFSGFPNGSNPDAPLGSGSDGYSSMARLTMAAKAEPGLFSGWPSCQNHHN